MVEFGRATKFDIVSVFHPYHQSHHKKGCTMNRSSFATGFDSDFDSGFVSGFDSGALGWSGLGSIMAILLSLTIPHFSRRAGKLL